MSIFTPRPGTDIYRNPERFGIAHIDQDTSKTMHMYGRYEKEEPILNFEYAKETKWGAGQSNEMIIANYKELQGRLGQVDLRAI